MISLTPKDRWTFNRYMEEVFHLSEIDEIPGIAQARELLTYIEYDLEPENLTCDGELPQAVVAKKRASLLAARECIELGEY